MRIYFGCCLWTKFARQSRWNIFFRSYLRLVSGRRRYCSLLQYLVFLLLLKTFSMHVRRSWWNKTQLDIFLFMLDRFQAGIELTLVNGNFWVLFASHRCNSLLSLPRHEIWVLVLSMNLRSETCKLIRLKHFESQFRTWCWRWRCWHLCLQRFRFACSIWCCRILM